jgi:hypothetical protein
VLVKVTIGVSRLLRRESTITVDLPETWTSVTSLWSQLSSAIAGIDEWKRVAGLDERKREPIAAPWPDKLLCELAALGVIEVQLRREFGGEYIEVKARADYWRAVWFLQDGQLYGHQRNAPPIGNDVEIRLAKQRRVTAGKQPSIRKTNERAALVHAVWVAAGRPVWAAKKAFAAARKEHGDTPLLKCSPSTMDRTWKAVMAME